MNDPQKLAPEICWDVLDPLFDEKNKLAGYDPNYDYGGLQCIANHFNLAIKRRWMGADLNRAFWIHDQRQKKRGGLWAWDASNDELKRNIIITMKAQGHPVAARIVASLFWCGVESIPGLVNYWMS